MKLVLTLALIILVAACGDNSPTGPQVICGDGVVEAGEQCDDGNTLDSDGCDSVCRIPGCGDGITNFAEACDDGNDVEGDGCDTNCKQSFCGNGIKAPDEACDDNNSVSGDGCDSNCQPTACGNGVMAGDEACDDGNAAEGDGCDSNCTLTACGNDVIAGTEQCDDGNTESADGCSATCAIETAEIEPNDDGTRASGAPGITGNDFATAAPDANGALTDSATIIAAISPIGDEDIFKLANDDTVPMRVQLDTWNLAAAYGIGTSCASSIDTGLQVKNAAGTVLASNDNRPGSPIDRCSSLSIALFPGDVVYVQVVEFGDNAAIASYALDVRFTPSVCGDGDVGPGELCDDSNTTAGDGCSATCQLEGAVAELEPNEDGTPSIGGSGLNGNDFGTAHPLNNGTLAGDTTLVGSLSPAGDEDIFAFTNLRPNPVTVTFDVWSLSAGYGVGVPCGSVLDTGFVVRDAAGGSLASNDDRNGTTDSCSTLTFSLFPGETRFAHLVEFGDNAVFGPYVLLVKYADIVCGDGVVGLGEQCDDSNTTSGDGCSATCQVEPFCGDSILQPAEQCDDGNMVAGDGCDLTCEVENAVTEVEPNEDGSTGPGGSGTVGNDFASANADANGAFTTSTRIAARILTVGDEDVFAFHNPGTATVVAQLDIWNNAPGYGIGVACGTAIDTGMHIRDAAGTSLASNDDRNGATDRCSALSFGIGPGQTVYAHVVEYGDNAVIPSYTLDVTYTPVPCGDGIVGVGEQCDDDNLTGGDGCSSTCQLENTADEVEPNDDGATITGATGITGNDFNATAVANANTNGAFTTSKRILAKLTPSGDEDVFAFMNPTAGSVLVRFDTWNMGPGRGIGVPCGTTGVGLIDTGLNLRTAAGVVLDSNNDRNGTTDRCSGLTLLMAPGETVYAHVVEFGDNAVIAGYLLDVVYTPIVCGDGFVAPSEGCDDSNTTDGDGCSSTCQLELVCGNGVLQTGEQCDDANTSNNDGCSMACVIENQVTEVEPNETTAEATASSVQIVGNAFVAGAIGTAGDVDRFQVTVATATTVRFETFTSSGDCSAATLDLRVFDGASNSLVSDLAGSGIAECGAVVIFLAAGTYYVQVEERGNNATVGAYLLQVAFQGNGGTETEPNETTATASTNLANANETFVFGNHLTFGDVDVYAITVPPNGRIRAELVEGDRQAETCESGGLDSRLVLLDNLGAQVAEDNDSGRGFCSLIDGTGTTPLDATARNPSAIAKTYYLMVVASGFATPGGGQFVYRLQVTLR
ncbi:MAG: DUF4215 domain-containing protein [Myxococcota bacterium]|nr:DUF4215 domain-containing protein [Myxococcota bacterium]